MNKSGKILISAIILIVVLAVSFFSYTVFSQTAGRFTVGNEAPYITGFEIQDGSSSWDDGSGGYDTHDYTPNFRWDVEDNNPDTLTTSICIGTAVSLCDIVDESVAGSYSGGDTVTYTSSATLTLEQTDCSGATCSKTYYVDVKVDDGQVEKTSSFTFDLINSVPDLPSTLTPIESHDQTPDLSWTATDADDGSVDKWPADNLVYHIQVGAAAPGDEDYLADPAGASASATITNPIPWGIPGATEARTTTYVRIWSTDNLGINSNNYEPTFDLVDNLPSFVNVYLSDAVVSKSTDSCIDFLPQNCHITPLAGDYTSVNAILTIDDLDADCSGLTHTAKLILCRVDSGGAEICDEINNTHYVYDLNFDSATATNCDFTISIPASDPQGIEFFRAPGVFKMFIKATSQAGTSTTPWNNYAWEYGTLPSLTYTDAVFLGDRVVDGGDGIQLGTWNPGLSAATMINHGNIILNLDWDATDPSSDASTCDSHTSTCWDLSTIDDLQVDDDSDLTDDTGNLAVTNIPETPTTIGFQPVGGLNICDAMACDNIALDETLDTYFHIRPPVGLSAGDYETTFTITMNAV